MVKDHIFTFFWDPSLRNPLKSPQRSKPLPTLSCGLCFFTVPIIDSLLQEFQTVQKNEVGQVLDEALPRDGDN